MTTTTDTALDTAARVCRGCGKPGQQDAMTRVGADFYCGLLGTEHYYADIAECDDRQKAASRAAREAAESAPESADVQDQPDAPAETGEDGGDGQDVTEGDEGGEDKNS